jgi:hypothetical protein
MKEKLLPVFKVTATQSDFRAILGIPDSYGPDSDPTIIIKCRPDHELAKMLFSEVGMAVTVTIAPAPLPDGRSDQ